MARPSVAEERTRQIVDATIRTIGERGITGASLDRIAVAAGMTRGHVRHFAGNRETLLREAARHFYTDGSERGSILPAGTATVAAALDHLFGAPFTDPGQENAVVLGFVEAARTDPELAALLTGAYASTHAVLADLLAAEHPDAPPDACNEVAYGVVGIALHHVFLNDIASSSEGAARARRSAERMIVALEVA
ncbi:TetR/AcrR family transcriptional regulator [Demequina gelatinilytica]|uniref:TetR/AcrR family transcriptional regulator n=1 Tax=Demequina gelatinilytica TaxID=1638980 RepID=UPI000780DD6B|nr:TetR family transcriptional regulator [Demequina gelatinilytica]